MALLNLDRLVKKDLFTAELWNNLIDVLEAKFQGGVSGGELTWPLLAQGDIDFQQTYGIVGLRTFWNIVNASEYASLDAAVSAVEATGGGAVFIPPHTTISATGVSIDASNVTIFGAGPTSVIKITAASTGPLFTTATSGITDFRLMNLLLDGTGGGAGCIGVSVKRVARFHMLNVSMLGFTDDFIVLTNGGVAGESCTDALITGCHFSGGTDKHLFCDDVSGLIFVNNTSKSAGGDVIRMLPVGSSNLIQDVLISGNRIQSGGAKGISIAGSGAAGIDAHSRIKIANNHIISMTGLPIEMGNTAALLKHVQVIGNYAPSSASDALRIAASGSVSDNYFPAATGDGIDATDSVDLWASGNNCQDAGAYGINATSTTDCTLVGNNLRDAVTDGINRTSSTNLRALENVGDDAPTVGSSFADFTTYTRAFGDGAGAIGAFTYVIPAGSLKTGDTLAVKARVTQGGGGTGTVQLRAGTTSLGGQSIDADENHIEWLVRIVQGGNSGSMITRQREDNDTNLSTNSATVDWSTDQTITLHASAIAAVDIVVSGIFIQLFGSK